MDMIKGGDYMANRNGTAGGVGGRSESDMTKGSSHDTREEQELRRFDQRCNDSMSRSWLDKVHQVS